MIDDEKRHTLHFGGRDELEHRPAAPMRAESQRTVHRLSATLPLRVEHLEQPFVTLRLRFGPALRFFDDRARVILGMNGVITPCKPKDRAKALCHRRTVITSVSQRFSAVVSVAVAQL